MRQHSPDYDLAVRDGRTSPTCDIREILRAELHYAKPPSRSWVVQWLVQQPLERFLPPRVALLLLRVVANINAKSGTAWEGRKSMAAMKGQHRNTVDRHARVLTTPWKIPGDPTDYPPLFRLSSRGWGRLRRTHWEPVEAGWKPFVAMLHLATKEIRDDVHGERE